LAVAFAAATTTAPADEGEDSPNVVPPPPPEALTLGEPVEPRVTIRRRDDGAVIEEYRARGQVYAVRVQPSIGPPYYLYDVNGDGQLDARYGALREIPVTTQWRLFSW
jgi:hypothetical protein